MTRDPIPIERKFGYEHMIEMEAIREELRARGVTDPTRLHFAAVDVYVERHKNDRTYREKSETRRALVRSRYVGDRYREALEQIAAGHNDARALAKEVLGQT